MKNRTNNRKATRITIAALMAILLNAATSALAQAPAFPGAEGFARYTTTGGRGGKVLHVTNLNDSGSGSLRQALEKTSGARIIVFDVSGTIELKSALKINYGDVTVEGQTAPGDGICLKNYETVVNACNVILRFMRFRPGDEGSATNADGRDAIWGRYLQNIILDHCSMSWCVDECASFYENDNFTMQWCLLAESMKKSLHSKNNHGYAGIWGGHNASFHHNMLTCHDSRNPRMCGSRYCNDPEHEIVDMRNCVVNNWGQTNSGYSGEGGNYNFVNNYYKSGPATKKSIKYRIFQPSADNGENNQPKGVYGHFYVNGNYMDGKGDFWDWNGIDVDNRNNPDMTKEAIKSETMFETGTVTTHSAHQAWEKVLKYCGAAYQRDALDTRYAEEARSGVYAYTGSKTGINGIIDSPADVGGYPELQSTTRLKDTDEDGMPDIWETANGLNPNDAADAVLFTLDAKGWYTNIEVYCNALVENLVKLQNADAESSVDEYFPEVAFVEGVPYYGEEPQEEPPYEEATYVISQSTYLNSETTTKWLFNNDISVTNENDKAYSVGKENGIKYSANVQYTIHLPEGFKAKAITMTGYDNYAEVDAYIKECNGTSYSETAYVYPQKDASGNYTMATHQLQFDTPVEGALTITPGGKQVVWVITIDGIYGNAGLKGDANEDGLINISDITAIINYILQNEIGKFNVSNADFNDDGLINITDVTNIINLILQH